MFRIQVAAALGLLLLLLSSTDGLVRLHSREVQKANTRHTGSSAHHARGKLLSRRREDLNESLHPRQTLRTTRQECVRGGVPMMESGVGPTTRIGEHIRLVEVDFGTSQSDFEKKFKKVVCEFLDDAACEQSEWIHHIDIVISDMSLFLKSMPPEIQALIFRSALMKELHSTRTDVDEYLLKQHYAQIENYKDITLYVEVCSHYLDAFLVQDALDRIEADRSKVLRNIYDSRRRRCL
eukprot:5087037-Pleurochrysis_carterae.AAC.1